MDDHEFAGVDGTRGSTFVLDVHVAGIQAEYGESLRGNACDTVRSADGGRSRTRLELEFSLALLFLGVKTYLALLDVGLGGLDAVGRLEVREFDEGVLFDGDDGPVGAGHDDLGLDSGADFVLFANLAAGLGVGFLALGVDYLAFVTDGEADLACGCQRV